MQNTISDANAATSTLFLGQNGEWWDFWLIIAVIVAAFAAAAIGVTTIGSIVSHKREARVANESLAKFQAQTGREIAEANARAAEATQGANEADLARLRLEAELAPRTLSPEQQEKIIAALKPFAGTSIDVWVFPQGVPADSAPLASTLVTVLDRAGWQWRQDVSLSGQTFPGIVGSAKANSSSEEAARTLIDALVSTGNLNAELAPPFDEKPNFGASTFSVSPQAKEATVIIRIGAKQ